MSRVLNTSDYDVSCTNLATNLLGKVLVRRYEDKTLKGRIVETECYLGGEDKASHSYDGKKTPRTEPMYMVPGTAYVYFTYGMYHCFNISSKEPGAVVLIRALEPICGEDIMQNLRRAKRKTKKDVDLPFKDLCNGPSKLCISLDICKEKCNKLDLAASDVLWVEEDNFREEIKVVNTSRIGVDSYGEEWSKKPLRFYILGNVCVSKRDKQAENDLSQVQKPAVLPSPYFKI